jgi:putative ABC transport system ATP-binding protein
MTVTGVQTDALVAARGLSCSRGGRRLFHDVDLTMTPGESLAVVGPSGSGKTTLLTCLAGLTPADAGEILVAGAPVADASLHSLATVLQGHALVALLTAQENVEVPLRAAGHRPVDAQLLAQQALADVGLAEHRDHLVEELSGGQQQRVGVARALASTPLVVIADEPTTEQDKATRAVVLARLFAVVERGGALILATHDLAVAERCDRTLILSRPHAGGAAPENTVSEDDAAT